MEGRGTSTLHTYNLLIMSKRCLRSNTSIDDLTPPKVQKKIKNTITKDASDLKLAATKSTKLKPSTAKKATVNKKEEKENVVTSKRKAQVKEKPQKKDHSSDEVLPVKKKRKIIIPSDDSGDDSDEYKPNDETADSDDSGSLDAVSELDSLSDSDFDNKPTLKNKQPINTTKRQKRSRSDSKREEKKNDESVKSVELEKVNLSSGPLSKEKSWLHLNYSFLDPHELRDANERRPTRPQYDPKTLYVPKKFLDKQTPAMRQWWVYKSQHWDCVLFFRIGHYYVLHHMDALTAVSELGLSLIRRVSFPYIWFFEKHYARYLRILIDKGYKVARIEQTENQTMMEERCEKLKSRATKFDKIMRRELCQVVTRGTRVPTVLDIENFSSHSNYLMMLVEEQNLSQFPSYGICFIDTSIGVFHLGQFDDDHQNSRLLTLLSHYTPAHIIYGKGNLSQTTIQLLNTHLPITTIKEALLMESQFWPVKKVIEKLKDGDYFKYESDKFSWPEGLKPFINFHDANDIKPVDDKTLAIQALGGCLYILTEYLLDQQLLALKKFQTYIPPDMNVVDGKRAGPLINMVIDATTIKNLKILGSSPSLLTTLDYCCTDFGKRLLKEWVCQPACNSRTIKARQNAVGELRDLKSICIQAKRQLSDLPDLERLITTIHAYGNSAKVKNHPDSRAITSDWIIHNKRRITDLITCLKGFKKAVGIMKLVGSLKSDLIKQITQVKPRGEFPDFTETLSHFESGFDEALALKHGSIVPKKGMDLDYDQVITELEQIKNDANKYLKSQSEKNGTECKYISTSESAYDIEISEKIVSNVIDGYDFKKTRKGFKRYWNEETKKLQERKTAAEARHDMLLKDSDRRIFAKFSEHYDMWATAVDKVAVLDVLISLAEYSRIGDKCAPEINDTDEIMLDIQEGIHPFITSENFVPNNTSLAINGYGPLVILTGPNMGGKSTIMRQVGLLSIMAHIGCHIPAQSCKLSLIDRVFTRLGANDDMRTGRSTFLVELSEAATFVLHATKNSLVLVDELGRGTSTHDGTAIAAAILKALSKLECRTLFSTHYHLLVHEFKDNPAVSPAHMACQVESEETDATQETVTFLYKLAKGPCPKSYGFNAARIAGIKSHITKRANELAKKLEDAGNRRNLFISLCSVNRNDVKNLIGQL
ncbi:DNA mismatch repair protein Msh6-like [Cotesia typhae]|uniref:DNA mismatch repair protein Msh6-like n=1 Tax=Cotesia typhae TaxID=2053667 RepID=UPI003D68785C